MAKRSPILGYNHNVRYRGVVFHVQTEDSGLLNPHLFTHLFHEGVIVSTRKLVYDAGANEEAIKALMQAQHKAVMKDLRKGAFDDKIDQYLGGLPGLEPRAGGEPAPLPRGERAPTEQSPPPEEVIAAARAAMSTTAEAPVEAVDDALSEPIELPLKKPRTQTAERTSRSSAHPAAPPPPPPLEDDAPTLMGSSASDVAAAIAAANAVSSAPEAAPSSRTQTNQQGSRTQTAARGAAVGRAPTPATLGRAPTALSPPAQPVRLDSSPVIEIDYGDDAGRGPRDTAVEGMLDHAATLRDGSALRGSDPAATIRGVEPAPAAVKRQQASHGAATLPAMKPPSRPVTPPIVTRAPTIDRRTGPEDSGAIEIYAPAPPSADPPPGERAGQYSVSRRDGVAPIRETTGTGSVRAVSPASPVPAGLGRPRGGSGPNQPQGVRDTGANRAAPQGPRETSRIASQSGVRDTGANRVVPQAQPTRTPTPASTPRPQAPGRPPGAPPAAGREPSGSHGAVRPPTGQQGQQGQPGRPPSTPRLTAPISARTPSPVTPPSGSGVVMTRPAVIVGAPPKPQAPVTQRVRKAREEEGRGFGQGLISEKSLDEVILAYLSEDAEDK